MSQRVQDLSKFRLPPEFRGRSAVIVQLWWIVQATIFGMSPQFLYGWRNWLLRCFGAKIGKDVLIRPTVRITYPWKLRVGDRSWVGDYAGLYTLGEITIGADAVVSQHAYLCTGSHDMGAVGFDIYAMPIVINDEAWVAAGAFIQPGLTIGRGSVIGARSIVTRDTKPFKVYLGSPAVEVGDRRKNN
ncbi:colanic acid biosynthesis acetyltransferase WcaF [Caulobacter sp. B11]|uniref:WcaF family extracellular polysaccharide biosynthesis acetyltransferase n=1 Tax=Caulobacter sp. B11 TaxID=2048899 RepID=UPI000C12B9F7|nr:WcaF family extracellular polysaccharide biosynthesis acetyltransferase [Caulobacter sp. B11]PHY12809.1 colanic acid biosynthesis acetyltransferase WcaF [Caulobacter sp. B11]